MSESRLPADLSAWPNDVYQLLGVRQGVDRRRLKQAYTALLRQFKPEHFPNHFRRIRDAYQAILSHVEWRETIERRNAESDEASSRGIIETAVPEADDESMASGLRPAERDGDGGAPGQPARPLGHFCDEELDSLWNQAIGGDENAYFRMAALERQDPGSRELYVRLYWLLIVWPNLDVEREARDWLVRGLHIGRLAGPAAELYRRELDDHPVEAFAPRCVELLNTPAELRHLADLLESRWQAAGRLERAEAIPEDLARFRPRFIPAAEELWARLLLAALDQMVWAISPAQQKLADAVWNELEEMEHLQLGLWHALDRVDFLRSVSAGWRMLRGNAAIPTELVELIRLSWLRPPHEIEPRAIRALGDLIEDPRRALGVFDQIHQRSSAALAQIGQVVENCLEIQPTVAGQIDVDHIQSMARLHIESRFTNYELLRWSLFEFCLREQVAPEWLVAQPGEPLVYPIEAHRQLVQSVEADVPLRLLFSATHTLTR